MGWSSPRSVRTLSTSVVGAVGPSAARTGSPGTRWTTKKLASTTMTIEDSSRPVRRIANKVRGDSRSENRVGPAELPGAFVSLGARVISGHSVIRIEGA